ncbi:hypothetical protein BDY19DRAFT_940256, partial [Irpex rosettiformis]
ITMNSTSISDTTSTSSTIQSTPTTNPNRPTNPFTTAASPALILAFLALGIFAGGFLCVLFLRRYGIRGCLWRERQLSLEEQEEEEARDWGNEVANAGDRRSRKRRKTLGPKPKLWDIKSTPLLCYEDRRGLSWRAIEPLSVQYTREITSPEDGDIRGHEETLSYSEPPSSRTGSFARWFGRRAPSAAPENEAAPAVQKESVNVHIAVTVAMPVPDGYREEQTDIPVYELGLTTVPCEVENGLFEGSHAQESSQSNRQLLRDNGF